MERIRIRVFGIVQGVGFRPFVVRIAHANAVTGTVTNKGPYVEIFVQGTAAQNEAFIHDLKIKAPDRSMILKIETEPCEPIDETDFTILHSMKVKGDIFVSPDIAICPTCQKELYDPANRRYLHPFINCTACGPRLTILDGMPYDRERTSMKEFPMCPACEYEYTHEETRRYHAQPVCCNECGPELYIMDTDIRRDAALKTCRQALCDGRIAAVKGIGGFHLCCDATNQETVMTLRRRKTRPFKPLAVMMKNMDVVRRECEVSPAQEKILTGAQKPILLLKKKPNGKLCRAIAPDNPYVGVMLPYAPVQMLLFEYPDDLQTPDCLVMTSANPKGAPICRTDEDVRENLMSICDLVLSNNRRIRLRADDSVMAWFDDKPMMIRRSRGYAPLPAAVPVQTDRKILGIGGELKNTFCLTNKDLFYLSPYIGDLSDIRSVEALRQAIQRMEDLLEIRPDVVACDLHPQYNSRLVAHDLGLPVVEIQHHYAHVLSCMAENQLSGEVIGIAMDGTGYGTDQTIWGGEFFVCDEHNYTRYGSIEPFVLPGGDRAAVECYRPAVALLHQHRLMDQAAALHLCDAGTQDVLCTMIEQHIHTIPTTSVGRLFDAVSAILGLRLTNTCEGEASMVLEFTAMQGHPSDPLPVKIKDHQLMVKEMLQVLVRRHLDGEPAADTALAFHHWLAQGIAAMCRQIREAAALKRVCISGGCAQNQVLLHQLKEQLTKDGFAVYTHQMIPANDGGIALGQAYYAAANPEKGE